MDIFLGCWTSQVKTGQNYNDHSGWGDRLFTWHVKGL
jgi:hypothetical protein